MGQRFQSVFILPSVFINENNPNNRSEKVLVFHNQWLYGKEALNINLQIMERLKKAIKEKDKCGQFAQTKEDFINHFLESSLKKAIKFVSVQELHNETNFHEPTELIYSEEKKKPKKEQKSLSKVLNYQDNNNGFFICEIQENLEMKYCFISGLEDTEINEYKTPKEYLELFYSRNDLIKMGDLEDVKKLLNHFKEFTRTPKEDFKIILNEMNN